MYRLQAILAEMCRESHGLTTVTFLMVDGRGMHGATTDGEDFVHAAPPLYRSVDGPPRR